MGICKKLERSNIMFTVEEVRNIIQEAERIHNVLQYSDHIGHTTYWGEVIEAFDVCREWMDQVENAWSEPVGTTNLLRRHVYLKAFNICFGIDKPGPLTIKVPFLDDVTPYLESEWSVGEVHNENGQVVIDFSINL